MRVVLQRVAQASVAVEGRVLGQIGRGLLLLVGFRPGDGEEQLSWMADKLLGLRIFPDEDGKMNLGLSDFGGDVLVVSQLWICSNGDCRQPSNWLCGVLSLSLVLESGWGFYLH